MNPIPLPEKKEPPILVAVFNIADFWVGAGHAAFIYSYIPGHLNVVHLDNSPLEFINPFMSGCMESAVQEILTKGDLVLDSKDSPCAPFILNAWRKLIDAFDCHEPNRISVLYESCKTDENEVLQEWHEFFREASKWIVRRLLENTWLSSKELKNKHIRLVSENHAIFTMIITDRPQQADMVELAVYHA